MMEVIDVRDVVIVDAVRTPFGKRDGALSSAHSVVLLADTLNALFARSAVDPACVGQVVGGCVSQVGMQTMDITRGAWLTAGLPIGVAGSTVDAACGSSQQAMNLGYALVASGLVDTVVACGVEVMSRVPMGSPVPKDGSLGKPVTRRYWEQHEFTTQFQGAERMAQRWDLTRADCDAFGLLSQSRAARAQREGRFDTQLVSVTVPAGTAAADGSDVLVGRDQGPRETTAEGLARLKPTGGPDGIHTAGTSSQISDGASALILMAADVAAAHGLRPIASIVDACLVGSDPVLMLTGPIPATRRLLTDNGLVMGDVDVVEINEAFAAVVLAWERELKPDMETVNPNGGAIALGHPLGATGTALVTKAAHELVRADKEYGLVTMCCGGGMGTGTLLRRC
jgi:acetyl-CoA C-acetyltransferase